MVIVRSYAGTSQQEEALALEIVAHLRSKGFRIECSLKSESANDQELLHDLKQCSDLNVATVHGLPKK